MKSPETGLNMPEWIAHRGLSWSAPENTLSSLRMAWMMGVDAVEVDIRLTADGYPVLFHDPTLNRLCGVNRNVESLTLKKLQELDVGRWKGTQWAGEQIPLLESALKELPDACRILIEVKSGIEIIEPLLTLFESNSGRQHQHVVMGFSLELVSELKRAAPERDVFWIVDLKEVDREAGRAVQPDELAVQIDKSRLDGLNLSFTDPARSIEVIEPLVRSGVDCYVWTVNNPELAEAAMQAGVSGIASDRPVWLKEQVLARSGRKLPGMSGGQEQV